MSSPRVSIILPCYNEEEHLFESIHELTIVAKSFDFTYEFIFVEDGSTDSTPKQLKSLEHNIANSRYIYHEKNKGRGAAIKSGYAIAQGEIVGYLDIDLEVSAKYIEKMVESLKEYDVAVGKRSYFYKLSFEAILRNILSRSYNRLSRVLLGHPFVDTETGFKFFKKNKVDPFFLKIENDHWFWDTEFMMEVYKHKLKVIEVPVEFIRNEKKISTVKPFRDALIYAKELFRFRKKSSK